MGLYDSLYITCPSCGNEVEFQSKADAERYFRSFTFDNVPSVILFDLNYRIEQCSKCLCSIQIQIEQVPKGKAVILGDIF